MKYKWIRYMAYILEIIIFYVLEQTPHFLPEIFGSKPLIIIPIFIMIALFEGEKVALYFGIFVGILLDISFSWHLGFYTICLPIVGFIIGLISRNIVKSNFFTAILISLASIFVIYSLNFIIYYIFNGYNEILYAYVYHYLPNIIYTFATSILFYFFNTAFAVLIREEKSDYSN